MDHIFYIAASAAILCPILPTYAEIIYVDGDNCPDTEDGSETSPYCSIQTAILFAKNFDEIIVAPGHYNESINFLGKRIALRSSGGREVTTIDATGLNTRAVFCISGEGPDTILDGFTMTGGAGANGGGMRIVDSSPLIIRCRFTNNLATNLGGGLYSTAGSGVVRDTIFDGNTVISSFGGGGGLRSNGPMTIQNCLFLRNHAIGNDPTNDHLPGAIYISPGNVVANCVFIGNTTDGNGGALALEGQSIGAITNCAFIDNRAAATGNAVYVADDHSIQDIGLTNCIFSDRLGRGTVGPNQASITYSKVDSNLSGTGNIYSDPEFVRDPSPGPDGMWDGVDDDLGDLRLQPTSPCIDAGNCAAPGLPVFDFDHLPRVLGGSVDMGIFETSRPETVIRADVDCDRDVDLADFATFALCFNKASNPPRTVNCSPWAAAQLDVDTDKDIDGQDFFVFASCYNKEGRPPRTLGCPHP